MLYLALYLLAGFIAGSIAVAVDGDDESASLLGVFTLFWPVVLFAGAIALTGLGCLKLFKKYIGWLRSLTPNSR